MSEFGGNCNIHGEPLPCPTCEGPVERDEVELRIMQAQLRAGADRILTPDTAFYLSFTDPEIAATIPEEDQRPGGPSWMGGCFVVASDMGSAIGQAHFHGCNPGGQVAGWGPLPAEAIKPEYLNRLLKTEAELELAQA